ncbi:uncharacterized protein PAC_20110 [Phialocephala subalpina]|uniref:Rhodopsin domain-containing protein n=1 Tax=Phialocephala subalpina TaxID=576137 RepID=A0A1L7XYV6_9HELO|nr:uncharacterized protein PAC_20110 [Phialocephala subalpina]
MAFTDVEDLNSRQFTLLNWFMWGTGFLLTCLRFLVRYHHLGRLFWDDAFQFLGMINLTILAILNQLQRDTIYALKATAPPEGDPAEKTFQHVVTDATREQAKLQFVLIIVFWTCLWAIKGSLLMFYRQLFCHLRKYMVWWWVVTITCIATWVGCILANFLECLPLENRFELDLQAGNGIRFVAVTTGFDILTDIMLMVLPIKILLELRIAVKQKIGVGFVFTLGHLIIIFSILRVNEISISLSQSDPNMNVSLSLWSILEAAVAVAVGALPSLKSLIKGKGQSSYGSYTIGSLGPYIRNTNDGTRSTASSKAPQAAVYALESLKARPRDVQPFEADKGLRPGIPAVMKGSGTTVTRDVVMSSRLPTASDGRGEIN